VFDQTATPVFGVDPGCLSPDMPSMHVADAMNTVMDVALFRQIVSSPFWEMLRWLRARLDQKKNWGLATVALSFIFGN